MTEEQVKLIAVFESKVRQLMSLCDEQREELDRLRALLELKSPITARNSSFGRVGSQMQ